MCMRNFRLAVSLVPLLLLVVANTDNAEGPVWGPTSEGCRISLSLDKTAYEFGESVEVRATVENVDREKLQVEGIQARFPYRFEFFGPNSEEVPLTLWGRSLMKPHGGSFAMDGLSKGQMRADTFSDLNRTFDMTLNGKYALIIHRAAPSELDPQAWINVVSNTVVFEIKGPKAN
jgi:hypothetical protein